MHWRCSRAGRAARPCPWIRSRHDRRPMGLERECVSLGVAFDLWKGESDAEPMIPEIVADEKARGLAVNDDGALIIRVARAGGKKEMPPIILVKHDGEAGYHATDLGAVFDRKRSLDPELSLYVVDQRQALHFEQVFRASDMAGYLPESGLEHLGFGTVNGRDGKPYKMREGGVLKLHELILGMTVGRLTDNWKADVSLITASVAAITAIAAEMMTALAPAGFLVSISPVRRGSMPAVVDTPGGYRRPGRHGRGRNFLLHVSFSVWTGGRRRRWRSPRRCPHPGTRRIASCCGWQTLAESTQRTACRGRRRR
jgi:hypothetical protein